MAAFTAVGLLSCQHASAGTSTRPIHSHTPTGSYTRSENGRRKQKTENIGSKPQRGRAFLYRSYLLGWEGGGDDSVTWHLELKDNLVKTVAGGAGGKVGVKY